METIGGVDGDDAGIFLILRIGDFRHHKKTEEVALSEK